MSFCFKLPKAELHAHLHGSIPDAVLVRLEKKRGGKTLIDRGVLDKRSLSDCFQLFQIIHDLVTDIGTLKEICKAALASFAADGVVYLELRSTPRILPDGTTCEQFVECLVDCAKEFAGPMVVSFILSINRSQTLEEAIQTVLLAKAFGSSKGCYVVGLDFSGNPTVNSFSDFKPVFAMAKKLRIPCTVHIGEVVNHKDTKSIMRFAPERLGHFLKVKEKIWRRVLEAHASGTGYAPPLEICPTSNMKTLALKTLKEHVLLERVLAEGYPAVVCTDDSGVFQTSLSRELELTAEAFGLSEDGVANLALYAFRFAFCPTEAATERLNRALGLARSRLDEQGLARFAPCLTKGVWPSWGRAPPSRSVVLCDRCFSRQMVTQQAALETDFARAPEDAPILVVTSAERQDWVQSVSTARIVPIPSKEE